MPRYLVSPEPPVGALVEAAMKAFSIATSHAIIRLLATSGPSTTHEIARAMGAHPNSVRTRIAELEDTGVVIGDVPRETRRGHHVRYEVDPDRLDELLVAFARHLHGE